MPIFDRTPCFRSPWPKPKAVIFDIDGTLAVVGDRSPYDGHLCAGDDPIEPLIRVAQALHSPPYQSVLILSGRHERCLAATQQWLAFHYVPYRTLYLRHGDEDFRPGCEFKRVVYEGEIAPRYDVVLAIDDDPAVVAMWAELGILCLAMPWKERP